MKSFIATALLAVAISALAGTIPMRRLATAKRISGETGTIETNNTTLAKREGTEVVDCYNIGTAIDRAPSISAIDKFCDRHMGQSVADGETVQERLNYGKSSIYLSGKDINGCSFVIDSNCNRLLRLPLDGCNKAGENGKQGGVVTDLCGQWRFDPGSSEGNDF